MQQIWRQKSAALPTCCTEAEGNRLSARADSTCGGTNPAEVRKGLAPAHTVLSWACVVLAALAAGAAMTMGLLEGVPFQELRGSCADERPRKPAAASSEESLACSACCCRSTMLRLRPPMAGGRDRSLHSAARAVSERLQIHFESLGGMLCNGVGELPIDHGRPSCGGHADLMIPLHMHSPEAGTPLQGMTGTLWKGTPAALRVAYITGLPCTAWQGWSQWPTVLTSAPCTVRAGVWRLSAFGAVASV